MRLGLILDQLNAAIPGGTGRFARQLARVLATSAPSGTTVSSYVSWASDVSRCVVPGVIGPRRLPVGRRALAEAWSWGAGPVPHGLDLVHAPTLLMPPRRRTPMAVTIHDAVPWTHPETLTPRGVRWHDRMGRRAAREADLVTVPTRAVAEQLGRVLDLRGRLAVVGGGWSLSLPSNAEARRGRLGLPPAYVAFVGTLEPRKGMDVLLDALVGLEVPLAVVGPSGWGGVDVVAEASRRGLGGRVMPLGLLEDDDLASVVAGAASLVVPSRAEGFGLPLLEAMALGTPVVASDDPALVEVGEGAPRHVPVGDSEGLARALREVGADLGLRAEMRARGLEVATRRTWQREAERLWGLYRDLVG